jgi:hypothetical protein
MIDRDYAAARNAHATGALQKTSPIKGAIGEIRKPFQWGPS